MREPPIVNPPEPPKSSAEEWAIYLVVVVCSGVFLAGAAFLNGGQMPQNRIGPASFAVGATVLIGLVIYCLTGKIKL